MFVSEKKSRNRATSQKEEKAMTRLLWLLYKIQMHSFLKGESLREVRCRKSLEPIERVRFTKSTLRQASIREKKGPSLGKVNIKVPHQRSPNAMKFEDRSPRKDLKTAAMCPKQGVESFQKHSQAQRKRQGCILLCRGGMGTPGCDNKRAR